MQNNLSTTLSPSISPVSVNYGDMHIQQTNNFSKQNENTFAGPNIDLIDKEFSSLNTYCAKYKFSPQASEPNNLAQIKYHAVLPYQHTLVSNTELDDSSNLPFFNASLIHGFNAISAESPHNVLTLTNCILTMVSFKISFVIDLTRNTDDSFWNSIQKSKTYSFQVDRNNSSKNGIQNFDLRIVKVVPTTYWVTYTYCLTYKGEDYNFKRIYYKSEMSSKELLKSLIFIQLVLHVISMTRSHKSILVHCDDGSGRCGVYLAIQYVLENFIKNSKLSIDASNSSGITNRDFINNTSDLHNTSGCSINVTRVVFDLRKSRAEMVRTQEQYRFLYITLYEILELSGHFFNSVESLNYCHSFSCTEQHRLIEKFRLNQLDTCEEVKVGPILIHLQILPTLISSNLFAFNLTPESESDTSDTIKFIIDQNILIVFTFISLNNHPNNFFTQFQEKYDSNVEKAGHFIIECDSSNNIGSRIISRKISINLNGSKVHKFHHIVVLDFGPKTFFELRNILIGKLKYSR
ncbi:MAG: hypothetical protein MHPSP_002703 [Paramarteilia canceri]